MRGTWALATAVLMMTAHGAARGQQADAAATVAATRAAIVARYVLPDIAAKLDAALAAGLKQGRYAGLSGEVLAARVTADMAAVAHDKHLGLSHDPRGAAMLGARPVGDAAGEDEDEPLPPAMARMLVRMNAGARAMEVLPGNIRYIAYDAFAWGTPEAEASLRTAMQFLKGGDAYIIDISRNGGGSPGAVAAMASYFLPAGTPLMRFEMRGKPGQATHSPAAPFSLAGKPLYVLTSGASASAAEEFATHVKAHGFGTLVGETTAGAGFRNDLLALPGGYVLSVSTGRAVNLKTGKDWERVGVAPAIATSVAGALPRARAEAMTAVAAAVPADEKAEAARLLAYYRALATPVAPTRPAAAYAGRYGERTVEAAGAALTIRRLDRPASRLVPIAADTFAYDGDPAVQVRFVVEGDRVAAAEVMQRDGSVSRAARSD